MDNKVRSLVVEGRVDPRSLAMIANSLTSNNIPIRSKSHLVSMIIESYADMLVSSKQASMVSTERAIEILASVGMHFQNNTKQKLNRISKQIGHERALEQLQGNLGVKVVLSEDLLAEAQASLEDQVDDK